MGDHPLATEFSALISGNRDGNDDKTSRAELLLGNVTTASYVEGALRSSFLSIVVAAVIGVVLAVATTVGIVSVSKQSPENTPAVSKPLVQYGHR